MYGVVSRSAAIHVHRFFGSFRMPGRIFRADPWTLIRGYFLPYLNQHKPRGSRSGVLLYYPIAPSNSDVDASFYASLLLIYGVLKSHMLQVFDLSGSRQRVGRAICTVGLTRSKTRHRPLTTCSPTHAKCPRNISRSVIDFVQQTTLLSLAL
jgi:hypothetical protein